MRMITAASLDDARVHAYKCALNWARDPEVAQDVVQSAMLKAWRFRGGFDGRKATVATWLISIARREFLNVKRAKGVDEVPIGNAIAVEADDEVTYIDPIEVAWLVSRDPLKERILQQAAGVNHSDKRF